MTTEFAETSSLLVRLLSHKFHQLLNRTPKAQKTPTPDPNNDNGNNLTRSTERDSLPPQMKTLDRVPVVRPTPTLDVNPNKFDQGEEFFLQTVDSILSDAPSFDQSFDEYRTEEFGSGSVVKEESIESTDESTDERDSSVAEEMDSSPLSAKSQRLRMVRALREKDGGDSRAVQAPTQIKTEPKGRVDLLPDSSDLTEEDECSGSESESEDVVRNQASDECSASESEDVIQNQASDEESPEAPSRSVSMLSAQQPTEISESVSDDKEEDHEPNQPPDDNNVQAEDETATDQHEDRIFGSMDSDKRQELMLYIAQHPFVSQIAKHQSSRRRYMRDIRRKAATAGMEKPDIALLEDHVWNLCVELHEADPAEPEGLESGNEIDDNKSSLVSEKKKTKVKAKRHDDDESSRKSKKKKRDKEKRKLDDIDHESSPKAKKEKKDKKDKEKRKRDGDDESSRKAKKNKKKTATSHSKPSVPSDDHTDHVDAVNEPRTPTSLNEHPAPATVGQSSPPASEKRHSKTASVQGRRIGWDISSPIVIDSTDDEAPHIQRPRKGSDADMTDRVVFTRDPAIASKDLLSFPLSPKSLNLQAAPADAVRAENPKSHLCQQSGQHAPKLPPTNAPTVDTHVLKSPVPVHADSVPTPDKNFGDSRSENKQNKKKSRREKKKMRRILDSKKANFNEIVLGQDQQSKQIRWTTGDEVKSRYFVHPQKKKKQRKRAIRSDTSKSCPHGRASDFPASDSDLSDAPGDLNIPNDNIPPPPTICIQPPDEQSGGLKHAPTTPTKRGLRSELTKSPRVKLAKVSPYFPTPLADPESCLPFPPIDAPRFGLIQEQLAHDPFRLLIATIFLNRTRGGVALPVLFQVFEEYPTVEAMATADLASLVSTIHCLGFQNQRAKKCIGLAQRWLAQPPTKGRRYRKLHYPNKSDGRDIRADECIADDDPRVAWEIAHLPGVGAYSLDSWRIFCRDELRDLATDWTGTGATSPEYFPEWKSVLPLDKELRAYLTWMWLKEGWVWDRHSGKLSRASAKTMRAAHRGGVAFEEDGNWVLETSPVKKVANGLTA